MAALLYCKSGNDGVVLNSRFIFVIYQIRQMTSNVNICRYTVVESLSWYSYVRGLVVSIVANGGDDWDDDDDNDDNNDDDHHHHHHHVSVSLWPPSNFNCLNLWFHTSCRPEVFTSTHESEIFETVLSTMPYIPIPSLMSLLGQYVIEVYLIN